MKKKFLYLKKVWFITVVCFVFISVIGVKQTNSYYGGLGLGYYGSSSLYGGYGGFSSLYGLYGGLYGGAGLYGGLYSSLYSSLYGGLYSSLYGGLYGSLYGGGLTSPFGLQNMYYPVNTGTGLNYQVPFLQIAPLLGVAGLYNNLFPGLFSSGTARVAQQVIAGLYDALIADPVLGPILLTDPITLDILASDAVLATVVAADPIWLIAHGWLVLSPSIIPSQPLLLSTVATSCVQCHTNTSSGALIAGYPLPILL